MIYILEDDAIMAECIAKACRPEKVKVFADVISAVNALNEELPKLIFLDILLTGPDGFTFLNEIASYSDTNKIPVVIVSSVDFKNRDLKSYGVVKILNKSNFTPADIKACVKEFVSVAK